MIRHIPTYEKKLREKASAKFSSQLDEIESKQDELIKVHRGISRLSIENEEENKIALPVTQDDPLRSGQGGLNSKGKLSGYNMIDENIFDKWTKQDEEGKTHKTPRKTEIAKQPKASLKNSEKFLRKE